MTARDFCYWLQGYLEISGPLPGESDLSKAQLEIVQRHLNLVFKHEIDPSFGSFQDELNKIHTSGDLVLGPGASGTSGTASGFGGLTTKPRPPSGSGTVARC